MFCCVQCPIRTPRFVSDIDILWPPEIHEKNLASGGSDEAGRAAPTGAAGQNLSILSRERLCDALSLGGGRGFASRFGSKPPGMPAMAANSRVAAAASAVFAASTSTILGPPLNSGSESLVKMSCFTPLLVQAAGGFL